MVATLACIPVLTFFAALFILMLVIYVTGVVKSTPISVEPAPKTADAKEYPEWWTLALIPVVVAALLWFLAWCTAGN